MLTIVEHQGDSLVNGVFSYLSLSNGIGRCVCRGGGKLEDFFTG